MIVDDDVTAGYACVTVAKLFVSAKQLLRAVDAEEPGSSKNPNKYVRNVHVHSKQIKGNERN